MQVLLLGNKVDLESERQVSHAEGATFAKKHGLNFLEISAKDYGKVETAFNALTSNILGQLQDGKISEQTVGIKVSDDLKIEPLAPPASTGSRLRQCC